MKNELESFNDLWERETAKTIKLLESLPRDGYDFRPDPEGRSLDAFRVIGSEARKSNVHTKDLTVESQNLV